MSVILNNRQWKKSYMLEFIYNGKAPEVFTFSVPPESEDFTFTHRINETKTYGGSVFDSYGNDTVKITLSGSTINEEKKLIYRGNTKMPAYLTGEQEVWELQKLIKEAQDINNKGELKVYLYDLSKMGGGLQKTLNMMYGSATKNWWRVYIKDFKIKRDKSKPNTYNYTMELLGVDDTKHTWIEKFKNKDFVELQNQVNSLTEKITEYSSKGELYINLGAQAVKSCGEALAKLDDVGKNNNVFVDLGNGVTRIINGSDAIVDVYNACCNATTAISDFINGKFTAKRSANESIQTYTVSFNSDGGSNVDPQRITYGDYVSEPEEPTRKYYDFIGWYFDDVLYDFSKPVTSNLTLIAKWIKNTVLVTFSPNGGSAVPSQYVRIGGTAKYPDTPTKDGYIFRSWTVDFAGTTEFDFNTIITEDKNLYAQWIAAVYVTFNSNGGTEVDTQAIAPGSKAVFPSLPILPDNALVYWSDREDLSTEYNFNSVVNANKTLYAKWKQITATLTFETNGGSYVAPKVVTYNHKTASPESTKEGYSLYSWCKDIQLTDAFYFDTTPCTRSMTLYARWTPAVLTVTFDSDGGSEVGSQNVEYDNLVIYPVIPTKSGNTFLWWQTRITIKEQEVIVDDEGNETVIPAEYEYHRYDFSTPVKENMTLYAKWFEE